MTDDEIDAAIRAVVPAECFVPNAGARAIYRAGMREAARLVQFGDCLLDTQVYDSIARGRAVRAIERAARGEG